ncbi:hypothetical protein IQ06DRAFT_236142 [Phaeosphaeriaceae sp. SRC1lsM3a]|nr:hypothetical protein IQ06DRAFT_236142 [Stagonospora sp. SRC1lsM3a]
MVKSFGLDDQLMVGTALLYTAYLICQLGGAVHGSGVKREHLTDWQAQTGLHFWYFCEVFYTMSTSLLKIAVGFFLLRITINPIHIWIIRTIMIITAFVGTTYTVLVLCQCRPISFWWDLSPDAKGECLSASLVVIFTYVVSALNSFADWTFGLLPIFIVKDLQMKKRAKVIVSSVIGLAAIGSTATIIRLPYTGTMKPYKGDFLYRTTDFAIWTTVEVGVGIVAGSMATLRPLVSSTMGSSGQSSGKWWSRKKSSMFSGSLPMDRLRPAGGEKPVTKTTITGGRMSEDSDKRVFLDAGARPEQWKNGINKSVSTTVVEERSEIHPVRAQHSNLESRRAGSPGADSTSTVGDHGISNATKVHDRF